MRNHAHLVLETPRGNLDRFMHGLETAYTVYFNRRHERVGHLVQGRYGAELVEGDKYLLRLTRYVHLNPVQTDGCKRLPVNRRRERLRAYRWSSYRSYIGLDKPLDFVDYGPVLAQTGARKAERAQAYRKFVETGLAKTDDEFVAMMKDPRWGIGGVAFQTWVRQQHESLAGGDADSGSVSFRRIKMKLEPDQVVTAVAQELGVEEVELRRRRKGSLARSIAARMLCKYAGLKQAAVAERLGMATSAAVCMQLKRLKDAVSRDPELERRVGRVERRLSKL